ncbi:polysaccharide deacetylase family protein [Paraburkholderia nemoris]|uniref:polysaccharide deacetylase family protein n=1 Tax=Paraburkholderia nemoris TaxID=2793076 RepID=UPI0038BBF65A
MAIETVKAWPADKGLAVMVTVMFETWPDGKSPPYSPMASPLREGVVDLQGISWAEYGGETGVWRIAEILDKFGIKATFATNARAVERYPAAIQALCNAGHEIAGHSYTQDMILAYMDEAKELEVIKQCTGIIGDAIGKAPVGWASPRMTPSPRTADILAAHGYRWHGDYNNTDLPYVVDTRNGQLVALMHSDFTDNRVMRGSPRMFFELYRDTFDFLVGTGKPEIINLTLHTHFGGRPPLAAMLTKIFEHFAAVDGVWYPRHDEVADWTFAQST